MHTANVRQDGWNRYSLEFKKIPKKLCVLLLILFPMIISVILKALNCIGVHSIGSYIFGKCFILKICGLNLRLAIINLSIFGFQLVFIR